MEENRGPQWQAALYCRLSREDGDRPESDSIGNQRKLLTEYVQAHPEFVACDCYIDDGFTGTNFDRPAFQQMLRDIEDGRINCVLVKDLSRFGRDYIDAGSYLERWFPAHETRFIAVTDHIDSSRGAYDMMMPLKNLFNAQYARDISQKVKSSIQAKQKRGEFIGAFACYGYQKDPENRSRLVIDPVAAKVVQRIFRLFESGAGKLRIARALNAEGIPCPSVYKRLMGDRYHNGSRLDGTTYWTYSTIHRILKNETYLGNLEQGRSIRTQLHGAARQKDRSEWIIVEGTHEAIISREQWERVQALLHRSAREPDFSSGVSPFAGYLKCGDCGRSMSKTTWGEKIFYICGSYKRYGTDICSRHCISGEVLERILLSDLNRIIAAVPNLRALAEQAEKSTAQAHSVEGELARLNTALNRVRRIKQGVYEDYRDAVLTRDEYLRYRRDYDGQEVLLQNQLARLGTHDSHAGTQESWAGQLVRLGRLTALDRPTIAEFLKEIRIFENGNIEITYLLSKLLCTLPFEHEFL
ncbi:MAG: recombinase family protein [Pseudoflavonifractor sp.]|nr:recombinase family protein [Pseudoflavonifractor sp.]